MNRHFAYLNFHTEYSSKGTVEKRMDTEACFSTIFYADNNQNNKYVIRIYKGFEIGNNGENNICFMSKDELKKFIASAQKICKFTFKIKEHDDRYDVYVEMNAPRVQHRFVLTWIRYAYEFPFNVYLKDAYKLSSINGFKRMFIFNLFNIVAESIGYNFHGDRIHAIGYISDIKKIYTPAQCKDALVKAKADAEINDVFCGIDNIEFKLFRDSIKKGENFYDLIKSEDFWEDEEQFKNRLKLYKHNKEIIKKWKEK